MRRSPRQLAGEVRRRIGGLRALVPGTYSEIRSVEGGSLQAGKAYHDIPGERGPVYRSGSRARADHIASHVAVEGRRGIDIGCSVGGLSFGLDALGASMTGLDYDQSAIATARKVASRRGRPIEFRQADLTSDGTWDFILSGEFDFAIWLSQWMWLVKQVGRPAATERLRQLSVAIPTLVFETAEGPDDGDAGMADLVGPEAVRELLASSTVFTSIEPIGVADGTWLAGRTVFVCQR